MDFWKKCLLMWLLTALGGVLVAQTMTARDHFLLGSAKYKCRACEQAVLEFTKAIELDKNFADAYYGRSLAYACKKDFVNASLDIDRAIRLKPNEVLFLEGKARVKLESGKNLEAKAGFQEAIRADSLCWQAWYGLALAERNIDSLKNSRDAFEKAIHLNPKFAMSFLGRAETNLKTGDYQAALFDLVKASELAPSYAKVFQLRSLAEINLQDYNAAIDDASKAITLDPESSIGYYYRGEAYSKLGQYAKAELDFAAATAHDKSDGKAWMKRGICTEQMGDIKTAKKFYTKAIKKTKGLGTAYANRAAIWEKMGKPKKALPDLSNAIVNDPENVTLRVRRGFIHLKLSEVQLASDDFVQATRMDPKLGEAYYGLGQARYQNGNVGGACEAWKQASDLGSVEAKDLLSKYCNE